MTISLNRAELAAHMGVSLVTVDTWRKEGAPVLVRGGPGKQWAFDLVAIVKWYGDRRASQAAGEMPTDLAEIEKRTNIAKMLKAELELAQARQEVAPIRDFERAQAAVFAEIRSNVMNVPQRIVIQLLGETDESVFKQKLKAELAEALKAASEAKLVMAEDDEENDEDE